MTPEDLSGHAGRAGAAHGPPGHRVGRGVAGRHAPQALIDLADLVSDIGPVKHPYKEQGVKAQAGVEF